MGVCIEQYRASIGHHYLKSLLKSTAEGYYFWSYIFLGFMTCHFIYGRIIQLSNDVEKNPGPTNTDTNIRICHTNTRSLVAELDSNYKKLKKKSPKVLELEAFCKENNISILAVTESWCNNSHDDSLIEIEGLPKIFRSDKSNLSPFGTQLQPYSTNL